MNSPFPIKTLSETESRNGIESVNTSKSILREVQLKQEIIQDVIAGNLSLMIAASRFQPLHQEVGRWMESATGVPGWLDGEQVCRTIMGWVDLSLSDRPELSECISQRLERELQEHVAKFGKVNLS